MGSEPPKDGNTPWDEILLQVQSALKDLNLEGPVSQSLVMDDLKQVFQTLEGMGLPVGEAFGIPGVPETAETPDISVVAGGRLDDPPTEEVEGEEKSRDRPDLKVAPPEEDDSGGEEAPSPEGWVNLGPQMKLFKLGGELDKLFGGRPAQTPGKIRVNPADDSPSQTLFHGEEVRAYRIECTEGALRVSLDGRPAEQLTKGQSLDVEARLVRVESLNEGAASGSYLRL